eukprot:scaffold2572_cov391-Prasinococcus_capsulatus_cf.AAC.8
MGMSKVQGVPRSPSPQGRCSYASLMQDVNDMTSRSCSVFPWDPCEFGMAWSYVKLSRYMFALKQL